MKPLTLKNILDNFLNVITSDSILKVNKEIVKSDILYKDEFIKMHDAQGGYFLVLPKGLEKQSRKKLKHFFALIKESEIYNYETNYVIQDYLEQYDYFEKTWSLLEDGKQYCDFDFSNILNKQQLEEINQHKISNNRIKTKGYWFWKFYFECICLNKKKKVYRIYSKEWGNRFWLV